MKNNKENDPKQSEYYGLMSKVLNYPPHALNEQGENSVLLSQLRVKIIGKLEQAIASGQMADLLPEEKAEIERCLAKTQPALTVHEITKFLA
jgi:hypothetical protein